MLIFRTNSESIELVKSLLSSNFGIKYIVHSDIILGTKIIKNDNVLLLIQLHYIEKIVKKTNFYDHKPMSAPFDSNIRLYPNTERIVSQLEYAIMLLVSYICYNLYYA